MLRSEKIERNGERDPDSSFREGISFLMAGISPDRRRKKTVARDQADPRAGYTDLDFVELAVGGQGWKTEHVRVASLVRQLRKRPVETLAALDVGDVASGLTRHAAQQVPALHRPPAPEAYGVDGDVGSRQRLHHFVARGFDCRSRWPRQKG